MDTFAKMTIVLAFVTAVSVVGFAQPALTPEERARIEVINLRTENIRLEKENVDLKMQIRQLQVSISTAQLKKDVEDARPGFVWDPATGAFTEKK